MRSWLLILAESPGRPSTQLMGGISKVWADIGHWLLSHIAGILQGVGLTGSGIGALILIRHLPTPPVMPTWKGFLFDCFQDLAKNNDRIGERVGDDGVAFFLEPPTRKSRNE